MPHWGRTGLAERNSSDHRGDRVSDQLSNHVGEPAATATVRTGDPRVDVALDSLRDLDSLEPADQLDAFSSVQSTLARILDDPEDGAPRPTAT
jgi:hypothetical protein